MSNLSISNIDLDRVALTSEGLIVDHDTPLTVAGADDLDEGTLLALDSVTLKWVLYVQGGATNENGIVKAVLGHTVETTGAGDVAVAAITGGQVKLQMLKEDAGATVGAVEVQGLRDFGIFAVSCDENLKLDNQ